jgi:hypothetical protein
MSDVYFSGKIVTKTCTEYFFEIWGNTKEILTWCQDNLRHYTTKLILNLYISLAICNEEEATLFRLIWGEG